MMSHARDLLYSYLGECLIACGVVFFAGWLGFETGFMHHKAVTCNEVPTAYVRGYEDAKANKPLHWRRVGENMYMLGESLESKPGMVPVPIPNRPGYVQWQSKEK